MDTRADCAGEQQASCGGRGKFDPNHDRAEKNSKNSEIGHKLNSPSRPPINHTASGWRHRVICLLAVRLGKRKRRSLSLQPKEPQGASSLTSMRREARDAWIVRVAARADRVCRFESGWVRETSVVANRTGTAGSSIQLVQHAACSVGQYTCLPSDLPMRSSSLGCACRRVHKQLPGTPASVEPAIVSKTNTVGFGRPAANPLPVEQMPTNDRHVLVSSCSSPLSNVAS
jgi:hypothetical protein